LDLSKYPLLSIPSIHAIQASWGVFDRDNTLRRAISDSLQEAGHVFYPRWKEWEMRQAQELDFTLAESQVGTGGLGVGDWVTGRPGLGDWVTGDWVTGDWVTGDWVTGDWA
jgi:hypothetical protein